MGRGYKSQSEAVLQESVNLLEIKTCGKLDLTRPGVMSIVAKSVVGVGKVG